MATRDEAEQAIIDRIVDACSVEPDTTGHDDRLKVHKGQAEAILKLAEAYAWLHNPNNPHG